ncbi:uncharacterized protein LOC128214489 [Mya arenaria]|uniref:uncharacterized protein LOC128214489 n=1 Tax=Mya arenaria TaxID=6604 RepID=UPI0022E2524C|nr:uncharacterized protein LOC128214489 [Mya arenaria]
MALAPRHLRLAMLQQQLAQARLQHDVILAALLEEAERERQRSPRRKRRCWVRDWILKKALFGHYETLMRKLISGNRAIKIKQIEQCLRLLVGNDEIHTIATKHLTRKSSALYFRLVQYSAKQHSVDEAHSLLVCPPYWDQQEGVDEVWRSSVTGHDELIAVTDIGMDVHHPELYPNISWERLWFCYCCCERKQSLQRWCCSGCKNCPFKTWQGGEVYVG